MQRGVKCITYDPNITQATFVAMEPMVADTRDQGLGLQGVTSHSSGVASQDSGFEIRSSSIHVTDGVGCISGSVYGGQSLSWLILAWKRERSVWLCTSKARCIALCLAVHHYGTIWHDSNNAFTRRIPDVPTDGDEIGGH